MRPICPGGGSREWAPPAYGAARHHTGAVRATGVAHTLTLVAHRDCTLSVRQGKSVVPLQLRLPVACTDSMAALLKGHAGDGKQYVVADYLCLIAHAKESNTWSFLVYSESTTFKTLKSLARMTGLDAGVPLEVHNEFDGWLDKYRRRQEQGQLGG